MEKFSFDEMYKMQKSLQEKYLDKWGGVVYILKKVRINYFG